MKKGQEYVGYVTELQFPNKGIVQVEDEDKKVVVKNALPGQTVRFVVNKMRKGKAEGRFVEVVEHGEKEIVSPCEHFGICGGCLYQTLPYEEQLEIKKNQVKDMLDEVITSEYIFEGILGSPKVAGYRNKMEFSFGDAFKDGPLTLGMHKRNSMYDIVDVRGCQIVDEDYRKILAAVSDYFAEKGYPFYHKMTHVGYLRHLLVRKGTKTGEILVDLVTSTQMEPDLTGFVDTLLALDLNGKIIGILNTLNDREADVVQNDKTIQLYGTDHFYEELLGLKFEISPFSFFQTNSLGAEVLYSKAREYVGETKDKVIFDLYSGTGTIAQILAPVASKVVGVEIIEEAVEAAKVNAKGNGLNNCEFIAGDVLKVIDDLEEKPDLIVLDPPRDGIHPKALPKIIDFGVDRLVYISCKPTSLARDLVMLQERGYKVDKVCCVDMFPNTGGIETVCLLSKLHEAKHHVNVTVDMDEMDLTKAESKATYKEIEEYVMERTGLHVTNLNIAQVKAKHGIIERVNYNLPKSENSRQPGCPEEKVKAIEEALRHFQMI